MNYFQNLLFYEFTHIKHIQHKVQKTYFKITIKIDIRQSSGKFS